MTIEREEPFEGAMINKLCFIPSRQTGIVSLAIQAVSLLLSCALVILLIIHIDGETIFGEETTLPTKYHNNDANMSLIDHRIKRKIEELLDENATFHNIITDLYSEHLTDNSTIHVGDNGLEIDLMELLRISSMVYIGMCILWLLSLFSLLASIKLDNLDLAVFNAIILCIVMIYAIIHALFVSILFFYLRHVHWKTVVIIGSVVSGLFTTSLFCAFSLALIVAWYRYVVYVNDSDQCQCVASIVSLIKGNAHKRGPTNDYSIPEATQHSQIPYGDDGLIQQFSHF